MATFTNTLISAEGFSLTNGGPFHRLQRYLGIWGEDQTRVAQRAVLGITITWVVLLVLSAIQGRAWGKQVEIPFLGDYAAGARFLIALPVLILCEAGVDHRLSAMVAHFVRSGLVREHDLSAFDDLIARVTALRDDLIPELLLLGSAFLISVSVRSPGILVSSLSSWHSSPAAGDPALTLAGWWFELFCAPLFRFLILRWLWRMALWGFFLYGVSKLDLNLVPTHADMAGGLGFLSEGQMRFGSVAFAGGVVIAAQAINALVYHQATLRSLRYVIAGYCVLAIVIFVSPLLLVTPALLRVKRRGLLEYGALASAYAERFEAKWIHGRRLPAEPLLGSPDLQSLADLRSSFTVVRDMRLAPIFRNTLVGLALPTVLPMIPVILVATPVDQLVRSVLHLLL